MSDAELARESARRANGNFGEQAGQRDGDVTLNFGPPPLPYKAALIHMLLQNGAALAARPAHAVFYDGGAKDADEQQLLARFDPEWAEDDSEILSRFSKENASVLRTRQAVDAIMTHGIDYEASGDPFTTDAYDYQDSGDHRDLVRYDASIIVCNDGSRYVWMSPAEPEPQSMTETLRRLGRAPRSPQKALARTLTQLERCEADEKRTKYPAPYSNLIRRHG